ncbi:MAG TPA: phosphate ABC transporter permease subunit PstC [Spirochaetia bacterium]|nr:phosphate ABC transporter permease subunit PstC [Spirochaetia bacterium]
MSRPTPWRESLIRATSGICAASALFFLFAVLAVMFVFAWPSIIFNGWHFLWGVPWSIGNLYGGNFVVHNGIEAPQGAEYGMLVFLVGTVLTSLIALVVAVPVSLGVAVFLTEVAPARLAAAVGVLVELLSGVPSVVFGLWGVEVVAPLVGHGLGIFLTRTLGFIPFFAGPVGTGVGLLSAGLVLAVMIIPIIAAISRDILARVPRDMKEQGLALGVTRWELVRTIVLPYARSGIIGAVVLGLGRAMGETMAVLMVSGSAINILPHNVYSPVGTMAANIVALLDSAMTDSTGMAVHALAELALALFMITLIVNLLVPVVTSGVNIIAGTVPGAGGEKH